MRTLPAVVAVLAACGSKQAETTERTGSAAPPTAIAAPATPPVEPVEPAGSAVPRAEAKLPPPTKAQLADYNQRMKAGWALQKQAKWAESVVEFEAALAAVPGAQRASASSRCA